MNSALLAGFVERRIRRAHLMNLKSSAGAERYLRQFGLNSRDARNVLSWAAATEDERLASDTTYRTADRWRTFVVENRNLLPMPRMAIALDELVRAEIEFQGRRFRASVLSASTDIQRCLHALLKSDVSDFDCARYAKLSRELDPVQFRELVRQVVDLYAGTT